MNHQNEFLLPDKSFWQALNQEQREALVSKNVILCPPILLTEIARHGLKKRNALLNLENIYASPHWLEHAKMDLLKDESSEPILVKSESATRLIREYSDEELIALEDTSSEYVEVLIEVEEHNKNLESIIDRSKSKLLGLVENTEDLSEKEWVDRLKVVVKEQQADYPHPAYERTLKHIETEGFPQNGVQPIQASIRGLCDTFSANTLENAYNLAVYLLNKNPNDSPSIHENLQRICSLFNPILTQDDRNQIFKRFLNENMPPLSRFAPHALLSRIWHLTIYLYLRENPKDTAPVNVIRDAEYMFYTFHKDQTFVSADKWHKKFVNEVSLFKPLRENFLFVDNTTKKTIQEGVSKLL